jgi:glycosyltransferase involved in cell wall biosynthesis
MPRFSVIIACYNAEATLGDTLASLRAQTLQDWEAICVDDGSCDGTLALLTAEAEMDDRLCVISQENAGPSAARNAGVYMARGEWIAFLDADDLWLPEKLAHIAEIASHSPQSDAIYGKISFFDPRTSKDTTCSSVVPGPISLDALLGENPVCTLSNLCVRRQSFIEAGGLRDDMKYSEDLEFLIRLVAGGKILTGTASLLVRYRASFDGLSANLAQMHQGWREAVCSAGSKITPRSRARAESIHLRYLARRALRLSARPQAARGLALAGMRLAPLSFLGGGRRGPLTLLSCLMAPVMPLALRRILFA